MISCSGIVLAGGTGRRMGAYKPLVPFRGRPLVAWSVEALAPLCQEVLVAHGPFLKAELQQALGGRVTFVADEGVGPLAALVAAAQQAKGEWLLIAPCDAPFLTRLLYEELLAAAGKREGAIASADGVLDPLVSVLRRDAALVALRSAAWLGARSPVEAMRSMQLALVPVAAQDVWDVDTPEDKVRFE